MEKQRRSSDCLRLRHARAEQLDSKLHAEPHPISCCNLLCTWCDDINSCVVARGGPRPLLWSSTRTPTRASKSASEGTTVPELPSASSHVGMPTCTTHSKSTYEQSKAMSLPTTYPPPAKCEPVAGLVRISSSSRLHSDGAI